MALPMSVQFPVTPSPAEFSGTDHPSPSLRLKPTCFCKIQARPMAVSGKQRRKQLFFALKAVDEGQGNSESNSVSSQQGEGATKEPEPVSEPATETKVELSELGSEIKKAMQQRKDEREGDLLSGVTEEVREIEWPAFGKVLGTTGVVIGVIAGSSVVLLTVNAVLAELSDRVFAGRGVQDFFS
ncbi:hypothetical protein FNV43_RR01790 [Rhamnella rubrinervis]|uniref:Preprotein translocase subunit SECE1 n=1 Tax=Rhamnella rubrinervis TaxID=2594499 RepID=A0A8K0MTA9_9ROSA|nr:hypothetical protein FNV43_RR01790 [Rhamnella rubrinervis]